MSEKRRLAITALTVCLYAFLAVAVAWTVDGMGGAQALQRIPFWVFLLLGPMIPLGVGHGIEFFLLTTLICLPLTCSGLLIRSRNLAMGLFLSAAAVWVAVGYFLGR